MNNKEKLDDFVVQIEFLLISVVQGVALGALASSATGVVTNMQFEYWIYILSGFLFILIFWSQAIMHVLSFIRWPLDMIHNFLYFLASLVEVMAFSQINSPLHWFAFFFIFVLITGFLYFFDLRLIKKSQIGKALYEHTVKEQLFELKVFVPLGLLFNAVCIWLIFKYPSYFVTNHYHVILALLQSLFALIILINCLNIFKKRLQLISDYSNG